MALGGHIADLLDTAGIPYCKGGVMSREAVPLHRLAQNHQHMVKLTRPEDMLAVDIFFDFEPVWGQVNLASRLHQAMEKKALRKPDFLKVLAGNLAAATAHLFWRLQDEAGAQLKRHPAAETLRVLAISRSISKRSSAGRAACASPAPYRRKSTTGRRCSFCQTGAAATNRRYFCSRQER